MDFPTIALLTDFGERDGFVGVMKGVMLSRLQAPVPLVDISHQIEPQDIRQGMWVLESVYRYFPANTVFVCIVDPGVGSPDQASLLAYWPECRQIFIAPDNGLLTPIVEAAGAALRVYDIRRSELYQRDALSLHGRSQTFHGRDVYAPVAALVVNAILDDGLEAFLAQLGGPVESLCQLVREPAQQTGTDTDVCIQGEVVATDRFGNVITNIPHGWLAPDGVFSVTLENGLPFLCPFVASYAAGLSGMEGGNPVILVPSSGGVVELAIPQGDTRQFLQARPGQRVVIQTVP
jgi:S-adenosylmethionine hydrolase